MSKRKYRVDLGGLERKNFSLGGGRHLTLTDGALLTEGHDFIKLFPTFIREVTDTEPKQAEVENKPELLVEEPIKQAEVEEVKQVEEVEEVISSIDNKNDLVKYAKEKYDIKLAKNKTLDNMKSTLLSKIEG